MDVPVYASLLTLRQGLASGRWTSEQLVEAYLERIAKYDLALRSYAHVFSEQALACAQACDRMRVAGAPLGPLHGLPIALKDLVDWKGLPGEAGSATWKGRKSPVTATLVEKLLAAGAIILGKTHMVEFALGSWGTNAELGAPRNPWGGDTHRVTGGSSSGSGAAVAAGLAPAAIGSDTGGSIRIPAALNGIVGLKPTHGRISAYGCVPLSKTLDSMGPMTRTVADAALLLEVMAGPDYNDPASMAQPRLELDGCLERGAEGMRVAVMRTQDFPVAVEPEILAAFEKAQSMLKRAGAVLTEVEWPLPFGEMLEQNGMLTAAEAFALHHEALDRPDSPFGPATRMRLEAGRPISYAAYEALLAHRERAVATYRHFMHDYEALLTPALPITAIPLTEVDETKAPLSSFTRIGNYCGACGLSVPAAWSAAGLPIGVQLLGRPYGEADILSLGAALERALDLPARAPALDSWALRQ